MGRPTDHRFPCQWLATQNIVNDDLKRPRLEQFQRANKENLTERKTEGWPVRLQVGTDGAFHQQDPLIVPLRMIFGPARTPASVQAIQERYKARDLDGIFGT